MKKIAILYQAKPAPVKDGLQKPMKPGGYADSGADIAYELKKNCIRIVTPVDNPQVENEMDWVFPDTNNGIQQAIDKGARTFWLNTVLFVSMVRNHIELQDYIKQFVSGKRFGSSVYIEQYLSGQEITVTVMPPGIYLLGHKQKSMRNPGVFLPSGDSIMRIGWLHIMGS